MPSKNSLAGLKKHTPPVLSEVKDDIKKTIEAKVSRKTKGFQVENGRAIKWDRLVTELKHSDIDKTAPMLVDEMMDYIFDKYPQLIK